MIEFKNLFKQFSLRGKTITALENINLTINQGDIFTLIGESGAGKSTLLRCINALEKPSKGCVLVNGVDIHSLPVEKLREHQMRIGMIFQHFNLVQNKTVKENILLPAKIQGKTIGDEDVHQLLQLVGIENKAHAYPAELSGGQKQRVAIARALITKPHILLCDEATSALDPNTTKSIIALLKTINQQLGVTIIAITHEMDVVKELASRFAVMKHGEITSINTVKELLTQKTTDNPLFNTLLPELPESLKNSLQQETKPGHYPVCRAFFLGDATTKAVISEISQQTNVKINILQGNIASIQNIPYGILTLQLIGSPPEIDHALRCFDTLQLTIEVLGYAK